MAEKQLKGRETGRLARLACGTLLIALAQFGCAAPQTAEDPAESPPQALETAQDQIGGRAMVLIIRDEMIEKRVRDQQAATETARDLGDLRLSHLYDNAGLRRQVRKILYLHGKAGSDLDDPAALYQAWQVARFEIAADPLQVDLPTFVAQASKQSRDFAAALESTNVFDEVEVIEAYAPGFQRVAFGEAEYDYMIWQVPDYATRSVRWHVISRRALDKREVFSNPLTAGPNEIYLQTWLDTLGEKAQALQP